MRVLVAGATGVIGRQLVPLLQAAGHEVSALVRHIDRAPSGTEPAVADALDREATADAVSRARPDIVVHQLTALPRETKPRRVRKQMEPTNRLRREGTRNLVAAADGRPIVAQSIAFAYEPGGNRIKDEGAPLDLHAPASFREAVEAIADHEGQITDAGGVVLRYGHLYGPGTVYARDGHTAAMVRRRAYPIVGDGDGIFSFVHARDAAEATVAALELNGPRILNIVDDEPAPVRDWLPEYARLLGARPPWHAPVWLARLLAGEFGVQGLTAQRGASNARARAELGWQPSHASWRDGFAAELAGG